MELLKSLPPNCNRSLKCQAIKKLSKQICAKKTHLKEELEELSLLWECSFSEDEILSCMALEAILDLVKQQKLPAVQVVQKIIDGFKASKSKIRCLHAMKKLFSLMSGTKFNVAISNMGSCHPFNVLLSSEINAVPLFVPVVKDIFLVYGGQRDGFFQLMDPFFKYVFLQNRNSLLLTPLRKTIVQGLVQDEANLDYVLNILSWMQHTEENSIELLEYLDLVVRSFEVSVDVLHAILRLLPEFQTSLQETMMNFILGIVKTNPNVTNCEMLAYHCTMNLSNLADISRDFEILFLIIKKQQFLKNKYFMSLLVLPLLQLVINSDQKAAYLFSVLNERLQGGPDDNDDNWNFQPSHVTPLNSLVFLCGKILRDQQKMMTWLTNLSLLLDSRKSLSSPPSELFNLICGTFYLSEDVDEMKLIIQCLEKMCTINPHLSIELFPLMMSKLKKATEPEKCLIILKSLPNISTNKVSTSMTLNFLNSSGGLSCMSASLLASLWKKHEDCFSYLIGQIQDCTSSPDDAALTQASCLREICKFRAMKHGKECITLLFSLLERKTDRPVRILCMEAIYHLCLEKVFSFQSFWSYFQTNLHPLLLSKNVTPAEAHSLLRVFTVLTGTSEMSSIVGEVLLYLWSLITKDVNKCVVNEAFATISQFPKAFFELSQLPEQVTAGQRIKMEEKEVDENMRQVIYGETYLELVGRFYSGEVESGVETLFASLMGDELTNLPRGIFFKFREMIKLSFIYQLHMDSNHTREVELKTSKLSTNCLHLTANSLLRSCFEYVINFIKQGMTKEKLPVFKMILRSLTKTESRHLLPPFNWFFILRPLLLHAPDGIDQEAVELSYKLLFQQGALYPPLGHVALQLVEGEEFRESQLDHKQIVMKNMADLLTICPVLEIRSKFKKFILPSLELLRDHKGDTEMELLHSFTTSLREFASSQVALKESKNYVWEVLQGAIDLIPVEFHRDVQLIVEVLPQVVADELLRSGRTLEDVERVFLIRSHLVSTDQRSISFLNHSIETFVQMESTSGRDRCFTLVVLLQAFYRCLDRSSPSLKQWVMEMMSFIKFSAKQRSPHQAINWLLAAWCSSVIIWSNSGLEGLLFFPLDASHEVIAEFALETNYDEFVRNMISLLPRALCQLLKASEWAMLSEKVLDLLSHLLTLKSIQSNSLIHEAVKESLRCLRNVESCTKNSTFWMELSELLDFREGQKNNLLM